MPSRVRRFVTVVVSNRIAATVRWTLLGATFNTLGGVLSARLLNPTDRGLLAILLTIGALTTVFSSLGTNVVLRASYPKLGSPLLKSFFRLSWVLCFALNLPLLYAVAVISSTVVDSVFLNSSTIAALLAYGTAIFWWFQLQETLSALGEINFVARASAFGSAMLSLQLVALYPFLGSDFLGIAACYITAMVCQVSVLVWRLTRVHHGATKAHGSRYLLREGWKTLGYHFGQNLVFRADRYLLAAISTPYQTGLYAVGATPAELIRLPLNAAGQYTLLDVARGAIQFRLVAIRARNAFLIAALLCTGGWLSAPFLIPFVFGSAYESAVEIFRVLLLAQVLLAPYLIFARALAATDQRLRSSTVGLAGLICLVGLGWILGPTYGAMGVAAAAAASYAVMSMLSGAFCAAALRVPTKAL